MNIIKSGVYSRAAFVLMAVAVKGSAYSRVAFNQTNMVYIGGIELW